MANNKRNNKRNNRSNNKKAYYQRIATRLFVIIGVLALMGSLAFTGIQFGWKLASTQIQMGYYYREIRDAESTRDYNNDMARMYSHIPTYRHDADEADASIDVLNEKRDAIRNSTDPVVAFAAKNGIDISIIGISLGIFVIMGFAIYGMHKSFWFWVGVGEVILKYTIRFLISLLGLICFAIYRGFQMIATAIADLVVVLADRIRARRYEKYEEYDEYSDYDSEDDEAVHEAEVIQFPRHRIG